MPQYSRFILSGILIISALWGSYLRIDAVQNSSLWMDEGFSYHAAKTLKDTGSTTLETGVEYGRHTLVFHSLQAVSMSVLGENEWGLRLPSLVLGILFPLLCAWGLKNIFPKRREIWTLVPSFLFLSQWQIAWSLQGRMYMVLQTFFGISLFFLWKFYSTEKSKWRFFFLFLVFAVLASHTHIFGSIIFAIFLCSVPFFLPNFWKQQTYWIAPLLIGITFVWWKHDFILLLLSETESWAYWYTRYMLDHHVGVVLFGIISAILVAIWGRSNAKKLTSFLSLSIIIPVMVLFFFNSAANYRYLFPLFPVVVLLSFCWLRLERIRKNIILCTLLLITQGIFLFPQMQLSAQETYPLESDKVKYEGYRLYTPQPDFRQAFAQMEAQKNSSDLFLTTYPEIARFYGHEPNFVLPFDLNDRVEWDEMTRPEYVDIPHFYTLLDLHIAIEKKRGFLILDHYAWTKLPDEVTGYIDTNMEPIWEKWENEDSGAFLYQF